MVKIVRRIRAGGGRLEDLDLLLDICKGMVGRTICVLADAAVFPCESIVEKYRAEFEERIREGKGYRTEIPAGGPLVQPGALSAHNQEKLAELRKHA
jgi:hypothetical protein